MARALPTRTGGTGDPVPLLRQRRIDELVIMARCARLRASVALWSSAWGTAADFEEQAAMLDDAAALLAHDGQCVEPAAPRPTIGEEDESREPKPGLEDDDQAVVDESDGL
jgi:hypothetical protein